MCWRVSDWKQKEHAETCWITRREPCWKRRQERRVKELCKDFSRVNILMGGKKFKQKHRAYLQNKHKITQKGITTVNEEISQIIIATTGKIKRYNYRINKYLLTVSCALLFGLVLYRCDLCHHVCDSVFIFPF